MTDPVPTLSYQTLDRDGPQDRLLVLLHGYAEPTEPLTDRIEMIDPAGRFLAIVPAAPFDHRGHAIWHRGIMTSPLQAAQQYFHSVAALDALLGDLDEVTGLPATEAVVGGFSQGGGLALGLLLSAEVTNRPAAGFGVCSFPPAFGGFRVDRTAAARARYWLMSAHRDRFAPIKASRGAASMLQGLGVALHYSESEGEHVMTDESAGSVGEWLATIDGPDPLPTGGAELLEGSDSRNDFYDDLWIYSD